MTIEELYVALSLKVDQASFRGAENALKGFAAKAEKWGKALNQKLGQALNISAVGIAGALGVAVKDALSFDKGLNQLLRSSDDTIGTIDQLRGAVLGLSKESGIAKEEILAGAQAYVTATGDAAGALANAKTFARVVTATGASMTDVASAGAVLRDQFGVLPQDMEAAFSQLTLGGKKGKIEIADMARLMAELGASFKPFAGSQGLSGVADIGAVFQMAAKDFATADTTKTGLVNLFAQIGNREGELAKAGVILRQSGKAGRGPLKNALEIIQELTRLQDKDPIRFKEIFGKDLQASQALRAIQNAGGSIQELSAATRGADTIGKDLARNQASGAFRVQKSWNDVKLKIAEAFTPERVLAIANLIEKIVTAITNLIDRLGGAENALKVFIAAWVVLKGMQLTGFLASLAGGLGSVAASAGAAVGKLGMLGKLGALGAAGAGGYAVGSYLDDKFGLSDTIVGAVTGESIGNVRDPYQQATMARLRQQNRAAAPGNIRIAVEQYINGSRNADAAQIARESSDRILREAQAALTGAR